MISAISFYHPEFPAEISSRELFEIVISDSNHRREGYLISSMLDYRAIGMTIFHQVLSILNSTNFRPHIKRIWDLKYEKLKKSYRVIGFEYGWSKPLSSSPANASPDRSKAAIGNSHSTTRHLKKIRLRIPEGSKIQLLLSTDEVADIRDHTFLDPDIVSDGIVQNSGMLRFDWSLDEIEEIQGYIAASANHCDERKLKKRLGRLIDIFQGLLDSFDDQGERSEP